VFVDALTPALIRATEAINAFGKALGRVERDK
jgi:hypothetical protein